MLKIVYRIPTELKTYIERNDYLLKVRSNVLKFIFTNPSMNFSEEKIEKCCSSYMEAYITMQLINGELEKSYIPSILNKKTTTWTVDKLTETLALYYTENDLDHLIDQIEFVDPEIVLYKGVIDHFDPKGKYERVW